MENGKKQADLVPVPNEGERRKRKALRDYEIVTEQFWPLMEKIDEWLEQHRVPEGREEPQASDVEDGASSAQARTEGLADTIRRFLHELDESSGESCSGQAENDGSSGASTSGQHQHAADQKPKASP